MKILIYDDTKEDIMSLCRCLESFFKSRGYDYKIDICENTDFLLNNLSNYDLIFLDVEINDENGINIGLKIRELNKDIKIIIISNYQKYLIDGYKVHADRYFVKPLSQREFDIDFENIVINYFQNYEGFYDINLQVNKIYYKDILYIDFFDRKTRVHFSNSKIIITSYPLKYWEEFIKDKSFSKPHKSFIINLQHISGFTKNDVILINEELIPLSRHYKKEFDLDYMNYLHKGI